MKLLELITSAAAKAGLQASSEALKDFLTKNPNLNSIEAPDELTNAFNSLMGEEAAKSNDKIKEHFRATTLSGVDKVTIEQAKANLPEETVKAIEAERNSFKRVEMLAAALKEEAKNAKKAGAGDHAKELERLNGELATIKQSEKEKEKQWAEKLAAKDQEKTQFVTDFAFESWLRKQKLASHYAEDPDFALPVRAKLLRHLQEHNPDATIIADEKGKISVVAKQADGTYGKAYSKKDNKEIEFEPLATGVLANNKYLATSQQTPPNKVIVKPSSEGQPVENRAAKVRLN